MARDSWGSRFTENLSRGYAIGTDIGERRRARKTREGTAAALATPYTNYDEMSAAQAKAIEAQGGDLDKINEVNTYFAGEAKKNLDAEVQRLRIAARNGDGTAAADAFNKAGSWIPNGEEYNTAYDPKTNSLMVQGVNRESGEVTGGAGYQLDKMDLLLEAFLPTLESQLENGFKRRGLDIQEQGVTQTGEYQTGTLAQGEKRIDLEGRQLEQTGRYQQGMLGLQKQQVDLGYAQLKSADADRDAARTQALDIAKMDDQTRRQLADLTATVAREGNTIAGQKANNDLITIKANAELALANADKAITETLQGKGVYEPDDLRSMETLVNSNVNNLIDQAMPGPDGKMQDYSSVAPRAMEIIQSSKPGTVSASAAVEWAQTLSGATAGSLKVQQQGEYALVTDPKTGRQIVMPMTTLSALRGGLPAAEPTPAPAPVTPAPPRNQAIPMQGGP